MALVTRYVNTASSGGDGTTNATSGANAAYVSLNAWEAAEATNLVTDGDTHKVICEGASDDTTALLILGWTTGSSNDILITANVGAGRHIGIPDSGGVKYRLHVATGIAITYREDYITVNGIQLSSDGTKVISYVGMAGEARLSYCILKGRAADFAGGVVDVTGIVAGGVVKIWNNLIYDNTGSESPGILLNDADAVVHIYNNTIKDCARGIRLVAVSQEHIKNNLVDCTDCYVGTFTNNDTFNNYNSSSDATDLGGTNDRLSQAFTYIDEAGDDFHLASGDGGAKDFGVTDPGSGLYSDDIDGDTRSGSWDIGMDEFVAVAAGNPWNYYAQQH